MPRTAGDVLALDLVPDAAQPEAAQNLAVRGHGTDRAADLADTNRLRLAHLCAPPLRSAPRPPSPAARRCSRRGARSTVRSFSSASNVALTTLCGLVVPSDLVRMSWMPADSITARTGPPAMTPVPADAGLSSTRPAPKWPSDVVRNGRPVHRDRDQVLLRDLDPLADRRRHLLRLAGAVADRPCAVADHHQRREGEVLAALDDLGHAVDVDDLLDELAFLLEIPSQRLVSFGHSTRHLLRTSDPWRAPPRRAP